MLKELEGTPLAVLLADSHARWLVSGSCRKG